MQTRNTFSSVTYSEKKNKNSTFKKLLDAGSISVLCVWCSWHNDVYGFIDVIFPYHSTAHTIRHEDVPNHERFIYKKKDMVPVLQVGKTWYEFRTRNFCRTVRDLKWIVCVWKMQWAVSFRSFSVCQPVTLLSRCLTLRLIWLQLEHRELR